VGRGGFSVVYRAQQVALDRPVAIKVLLADLEEEDQVRRFTNECRVLGKLGLHRNVVDVHDAGVTDEGRPFIVMKFYARGALSDRLKSGGTLPASEVGSVGVKMATALQAAHAIGVIHRDVKPDNILIDDDGEPVLTDFGVAAVADAAGQYTSSVAFSRAHVAPEVLDRNAFGVASDVYGLGSTLFTLLTGRAAFASDTEARQILAIMNDPVPRAEGPGVPAALGAVIAKAMAKDPADRFATAELLRQALSEVASGGNEDVAVEVDKGPGPVPSRMDSDLEATVGGVRAVVLSEQSPGEPSSAPSDPELVTVRRDESVGLDVDDADVTVRRPPEPSGPIAAAPSALTAEGAAPDLAPEVPQEVERTRPRPVRAASSSAASAAAAVAPPSPPASTPSGARYPTSGPAVPSSEGSVQATPPNPPAPPAPPAKAPAQGDEGGGAAVAVPGPRRRRSRAALVLLVAAVVLALTLGGMAISMVVSSGGSEPVDKVYLPNVVFSMAENARQRLENLGFSVRISPVTDGSFRSGIVLDQSPAPDYFPKGTIVSLEVSQ
jgi:serine/threonine protein kinase